MLGWIKCIVLAIGSIYFLYWSNFTPPPRKKYNPSRYNGRGAVVYRSKAAYNTGLTNKMEVQ